MGGETPGSYGSRGSFESLETDGTRGRSQCAGKPPRSVDLRVQQSLPVKRFIVHDFIMFCTYKRISKSIITDDKRNRCRTTLHRGNDRVCT